MEEFKKAILVRNGTAVGALGDKYFSTAPIGTVLSFAGQTAPHGYLLANGASYKVADYPDLYAVIGNTYGGDTENFNVPDYRETVLVGVGENTTDTIASHDVYGLGEFKDDQLQKITGDFEAGNRNTQPHANGVFSVAQSQYNWFALSETATSSSSVEFDSSKVTRSGTTTHGKQKGVTYIIKAFHTNEGVDSGVSGDVINYVNNLNSYSTEETLTGGKWIDGKPIYRRVFIGSWSATTNIWTVTNISVVGFETLISASCKRNAKEANLPAIQVEMGDTLLNLATLTGTFTINQIILEYTKTTD